MAGLGGQATDIDLHAKEILRMRMTINTLLAKHSGQKVDRIEKDVERDYIMNPEQAKEYGMIDEIIYKHRYFCVPRSALRFEAGNAPRFQKVRNLSTFSFAQGNIRPRIVDRDSVKAQRRRGLHTSEKI